MDGMIYVSMAGANEAMLAQSIHANNLANVSTPGFKADFQQMRSQPVFGPIFPTRVFPGTESPGSNFVPGPIKTTDNPMDLAVAGPGWLAVQTADGGEAYTRRGDLTLNAAGQLLNGAGQLILGDGGPVTIPPAKKLEIGTDGTISIIPKQAVVDNSVVVGRLKLVNPDTKELTKGLDGLFRLKSGEPAELDASVRLHTGIIEMSNVNIVGELIDLMTNARQHEMNLKLLSTAEENDQASARVMQVL